MFSLYIKHLIYIIFVVFPSYENLYSSEQNKKHYKLYYYFSAVDFRLDTTVAKKRLTISHIKLADSSIYFSSN
jgi:hypothetical protein